MRDPKKQFEEAIESNGYKYYTGVFVVRTEDAAESCESIADSMAIEAMTWYSGMDKEKVKAAFLRFKTEFYKDKDERKINY